VWDDGRRWKDFGTDDGGDVIDFVAKVEGLDKSAAAKRLIELHRGELASERNKHGAAPAAGGFDAVDTREEKERKRMSWPPFRPLTETERCQLAELRCLEKAAIDFACARGCLLAIDTNETAWVVSDERRTNAQARRLDGQPWRRLPGEPKAWTLPGSEAAWPVGLADAGPFDGILLVEGSPDLVAAHQLILEGRAMAIISPVAMLGASLRMTEATIERFRDRRVIICPHVDANGHGLAAARKWAIQLRAVALSMSWIDLSGLRRADGSPVKDLCDLMAHGVGGHDVNAEVIAGFANSLRNGGAA